MKDLYNRNIFYEKIELDDSYPEFILKNRNLFLDIKSGLSSLNKKNKEKRKKICYNCWKKYHKFMNSYIVARHIIDKTYLRKKINTDIFGINFN